VVELVLVVAITAMVSAIAVPRYANSVARYRADSAARRVAADLALAQNNASTAGRPQSVVFVSRSYQMPGMAHLDGKSYGDYTVDLGADPYSVTRVAAEFGGDATVKFDLYGAPDTGGSVVVEVGDVRRVVVLSPDSGSVLIK
jgi:type II secretory pathway pseudopilin PulG